MQRSKGFGGALSRQSDGLLRTVLDESLGVELGLTTSTSMSATCEASASAADQSYIYDPRK
jgi:hypothetical protein